MLKRLALSVAVIAFCSNCTPDNEDSNNAATTNGGTTDTAGTSTQASAGTIAQTGGNAGVAGTPNGPMPTAGTVGSSAGTPGDTGGPGGQSTRGGSSSDGQSEVGGQTGGAVGPGGQSIAAGGDDNASSGGISGPSAGDSGGQGPTSGGMTMMGGAIAPSAGVIGAAGERMMPGGESGMAGESAGGTPMLTGGNIGGARSGFGGEEALGGQILPTCEIEECPADRPFNQNCDNGMPPRLECQSNGDGLCEWRAYCQAPNECPDDAPNADNDELCDAIDTLCNFDEQPIVCAEAQPDNCAENEVPEVKDGCFSGRCVTWAECGLPPECDEDIPCGNAPQPNCTLTCVNFRCESTCVQCQDPGCASPCLFGSRLDNNGCPTCLCIDPPVNCPQEGGDSQREYESIDSDFCAVNNLNCGVDREVFSQPGCGCGCQRRACTAELDVVCGQNGQRYNNACLMTQAGQQETEDWVSAGCCEGLPQNCGLTCVFGYTQDENGCDACQCKPTPLVCPDETSPSVTYLSGNPAECVAADLNCDPGEIPFDDPICGCGCQSANGDACPAELSPVCGTDGQTYFNRCFANAAGIDIQADGECPNANPECVPSYVVCRGQDGQGGRCNGQKVVVQDGCTYPVCHCELPNRCPFEGENPGLDEPGEFMCAASGECIVEDKVCDREPDCPGGTDEGAENNCPAPGQCRDFEYHCGDIDNTCILDIERCNNVADCPGDNPDTLDVIESPDEQGCNCATDGGNNVPDQGNCLCPTFETYCNTVCEAGETQACNQDAECVEGDVCIEGECLPALPYDNCERPVCDCGEDCKDPNDPTVRYVNEDPAACATLNYECQDNETKFYDLCGCGCEADEFVCGPNDFRCSDGTCIPADWECDIETYDCPDRSDEWPGNQNCARFFECEANGELRCDDGSCFIEEDRCDGEAYCLSGDDERNCPP